jgi:hypothetical protein
MAFSPLNTSPLTKRIRAPFAALRDVLNRQGRAWNGWDNDFQQRAMNATAGSNPISLIGTDSLNNPLVNGGAVRGFTTEITYNVSANGKISTSRFFTNSNDDTPLEIVAIKCTFATAAGSALTAYVSKEKAGQAPGAGTSTMSGTFNLNATANTVQSATLAASLLSKAVTIQPGEHLSIKLSAAVGSLAGLLITVYVRPFTQSAIATYARAANGDIATATMYLNVIPGQVVRAVAFSCSVASTDAGAVTGDVTKDTGTNAPGAGTSILAATVNLKTITPNTATYPTLATSSATKTMAAGDRLAFKLTGTPTALAGLVVTVFFNTSATEYKVIPVSLWDAPATDRNLYLSDGHYIVSDFWMTWSTASTSNFQMLTKDTGTNAPGAGTDLLTDNTNQGIDTNATANTPVGSLLLSAVSTKPTLWVAADNRLSVDSTGTTGSLAGVFAAILLRRA